MTTTTTTTSPRACTFRRRLDEPRGRAAVLACLGALALFLVPCLSAQEDTVDEPVGILRRWVEVQDSKGRTPGDLSAADLAVREGGPPLPLERLATGAAPARLTLYFDKALAGPGTLRRATESFSALAGPLTELGTVEIVLADDEVESVLETRDELVLGERLSWTLLAEGEGHRVLTLRERTLRDLELAAARGQDSALNQASIVHAAINEELELVRERQDQLLAWLGGGQGSPQPQPRMLFLVSGGFDLDPVAFYSSRISVEAARLVIRATVRSLTLEARVRDTARVLAAAGWTVMPVDIAGAGPERPIETTTIEMGDQHDDTRTAGAGITLHPGSIFRRRQDGASQTVTAPVELSDARAPLRLLAEASGGDLISSQGGLGDAIDRFSRRIEVAWRTTLAADAGLQPLELEATRPGLTVRGPRWITRGTPEAVTALRLRRLMAGFDFDDALVIDAALHVGSVEGEAGSAAPEAPKSMTLEARLDLRELKDEDESLARGDFRVAVGLEVPGEGLRLRQERLPDQDLRGLEDWLYRTDLEVPEGAGEIAVLIEELRSGRWGGVRPSLRSGTEGELLPRPLVVEIERPDEDILRGRVKFETQVYDRRVDRVVFLLDEAEVAEARRPPFSARIDLGRAPHRQTLSVIAYDVTGNELGRDSALINAGSGGLQVKIVRPQDFRGSGPAEVEAEIAVPVERRLERVLFFWRNQAVATLYGPPFIHRVDVPADDSTGYLRVVAMLDDGSTAEDIVFVNGPRHGERLDVNLVELYVVVTDRAGRPVRGLSEDDFRVREDGDLQSIATFSDASDLPLTLGLAIDSSASMFVKLPRVQKAAIDFLRSTFADNDRAFVVDFDSEPRLAYGTSSHLDRVVRAIENLEASGRTALWESIVYSLLQLQGVKGRKALIVYSDGADEDEDFSFGSCFKVAKRMGVPIYLILMRKKPEESAGLSLLVRSFTSRVERLVEATGGRVFYAREYPSLDGVYADIEHELRSQYLLTYYPSEPAKARAWRDVDVDVERPGLTPRTLSGYWQ